MLPERRYVLPLLAAYELLESHGFTSEAAILRSSIPGKEAWKRRAKRGMAIEVLRSKNLFDKFISDFWPSGVTDEGKREIGLCEKYYQQWKNSVPEDTENDSP